MFLKNFSFSFFHFLRNSREKIVFLYDQFIPSFCVEVMTAKRTYWEFKDLLKSWSFNHPHFWNKDLSLILTCILIHAKYKNYLLFVSYFMKLFSFFLFLDQTFRMNHSYYDEWDQFLSQFSKEGIRAHSISRHKHSYRFNKMVLHVMIKLPFSSFNFWENLISQTSKASDSDLRVLIGTPRWKFLKVWLFKLRWIW